MNIGERILNLRKAKGISQEELAEQLGVSRQAVSKWESEQSLPEVDKIVFMSEYFQVSTDYILRGTESEVTSINNNETVGKIFFLGSVFLAVVGLLVGFADWYEHQALEKVAGAIIIQLVGVLAYFMAKYIFKEKASRLINLSLIMAIAIMPLSMFSGFVSQILFHQGQIAPYPFIYDFYHWGLFISFYLGIWFATERVLKR